MENKKILSLIKKYKKGMKNGNGIGYRNKILESYFSTVKSIAGKINKKIPLNNKYEDLISEGFLGLIEAIEKFNFERGEYFSAYANHRIKGKMLDYLRENDWVPRSVRTRATTLNKARQELKSTSNYNPTKKQVLEELSKKIYIDPAKIKNPDLKF